MTDLVCMVEVVQKGGIVTFVTALKPVFLGQLVEIVSVLQTYNVKIVP